MLRVVARKAATLRREVQSKGVVRVAKITLDRAAIFLLSKFFSFPASWHPPTSMRPYRITISKVVNELNPSVVCEVGCGLGSILSRLNAPQRIGYDIDPGVVRAARLLRSRGIQFLQGTLDSVSVPRIDVLILVNWIHEINPDNLEQLLVPLLPRTRYLLLDAIDPDNSFGYRYKHDFAFLAGRAERVSVTRHPGEGRSFQLYEVLG